MNVLGIIAEYNPFHNGHLYHLRECVRQAEADCTVIVMSGNFTQRGEPAVLDKWTRSRLAIQHGADLVLELPFAYAANSAEYFAKGSVSILERLGCITHLGFGTEQGNADELRQIARFLAKEPEAFRRQTKQFMEKGESYARARSCALSSCLGEEATKLLQTPNNILGVEYLKQLEIQDSSIKSIMVNRKGAGYLDREPTGGFASATAIRHHLSTEQRKRYIPPGVEAELRNCRVSSGYFDLVRGVILRSEPGMLSQIFSVSEGLENRLKRQIRKCSSLEELVETVSSKRYPKTRVRRILCQSAVGLGSFDDDYYARVLAASEKGTGLLRQIKKTSEIPVITNINKLEKKPSLLKYDILASDLYNLITGGDLYKGCDYVARPYIHRP